MANITIPRRLAALGSLTGACAATAVLCATPAAAHVSVDPDEAEQGGYSTVNFKVPNERENASTIKVEITLPTDHPLASVMPQPVPGWDVEVTRAKVDTPVEVHGEKLNEAPSKITWSGGSIEPGTFQQFPVSVGPLPEDTGQLVFKALQTYDNKEIGRWIEEPRKDGEEPENPAPVLRLAAPAEGSTGRHDGKADAETAAGQGAATADTGALGTEADEVNSANGTHSRDNTARVLGALGVVTGLGGVAFGALAVRRARRP